SQLDYFWFIKSGTSTQMFFGNPLTGEAAKSLRIEYVIGESHAPYAGVYYNIENNLEAAENLEFWFKGDASGRTLALLLNEKNGRYWQYNYPILGNEPEFLSIPLSQFTANDTAQSIRLDAIDEISFNILQGEAEPGDGIIYLDDIYFLIPAIETVINEKDIIANPADFCLSQNFPNPFNPKTVIQYELPVRCHVEMKVFNVLGQKIASLVSKKQKAGVYQIEWDATQYASGIYYYQLKTDNGFIKTRKMVLIK
ncbi:MAG TPA: T9SS type A sorting domain-containing protein, partial [Caldithrix sp.]|nr:T9SS type A sorting domain-containing protein [Caldithrix sp.]